MYTQWRWYLSPEDAWDAMYDDCARAERSIDIEQYILNNDAVGFRFLSLCREKARAGIAVRVLLDGVGSYWLYNSQEIAELSHAGASVHFFNHVSPWRVHTIAGWFLRDHRKLIIVDSRVGYTGGVGIDARMRGWRDTQVRIEGLVVREMGHAFDIMWEHVTRGVPHEKKKVEWRDNFQFLLNAPRFRQRLVYQSLIGAIRGATRSVYLTTPYFIPDFRFSRAIRRAARRGVDVRILMSEVSDHPSIDIASDAYIGTALAVGIRVFKFQGKVVHAKTVVVDDVWATVGSTNLDNLSLTFNYEANIASLDAQFVADLKQHFLTDLYSAREITVSDWERRPIRRKLLELLSWPIHRFL